VRSLVVVGGLSIAAVRGTLAAVDDPRIPLHHTLGLTIEASDPDLAPAVDDEAQRAAEAQVDAVLATKGWRPHPDSRARQAAIDCLATMRRVADERLVSVADAYADAVEIIAEADLDTVSVLADPAERVETALVGTVLGDRLIAALRRIAQEHVSARRFPVHPG
jgi:hypothetical protein